MNDSTRGTIKALAVSVGAVLGVCLILVFRDPSFFWVCDYQLWFSGVFEEIARAWSEGEWPILCRGSWAVPSLAGEYQCGTFSIFFNLCLVLLWKLPLGLAARAATLSIVHLAVLAAGATMLARSRGISPASSSVVGIITALNGWLINWAATEWFVALAGFTWIPWTWWAFERSASTAGGVVRWVYPALFVYLTVSAGSPFAVLMLAILSVWLMLRTMIADRSMRQGAAMVFAWLAGLALSAPSWLMLLEYHAFSTRAAWGTMVQRDWVVPPVAWLGLIQPAFVTNWRHWLGTLNPHCCIEMAGGLLPSVAAIVCLARERLDFLRRHKWDLLFLAACVAVVSAPSFGSFRWSFRSMPLVHLTLVLLGGTCLDRLSARTLAGVTLAFSTVVTAGVIAAGRNASNLFAAIQSGILAAWFIASALLRRTPLPWANAAVATGLQLATYLCLSTHQSVSQHKFRDNLLFPAPLDSGRLYLGLYSFADILRGAGAPGWGSLVRPCNTTMCAPLRFLNGYTSFTLRGVPSYFETHGSLQPQTVDALLSPECSELLDLLGVDGLVFAPDYIDRTPILGLEWQLAYASDEATVFHREPLRFAAAKTLRRIDSRPGELLARPEVHLVKDGRNEVVVQIEPLPDTADSSVALPSRDPSRSIAIAFGRPFLPGYRATLNGKPLAVTAYQDVVPVVELPPNSSGTLALSYWPESLRRGVLAAGVGASALLIATLSSVRRRLALKYRN